MHGIEDENRGKLNKCKSAYFSTQRLHQKDLYTNADAYYKKMNIMLMLRITRHREKEEKTK